MNSGNPSDSLQSYSQYGEDVEILEFFGFAKKGFFVEAGANHPSHLSQTYLFEQQGWTGILVEPVPECCDLLRAQRSARVFQNALGSPGQCGPLRMLVPGGLTELASACTEITTLEKGDLVIETEVVTLDSLLQECGVDSFDFLSLDMEGMELDALQGLSIERHRPSFILIEDRNESLAKHRYLKRCGYKLIRRKGSNNWYVPNTTPFKVSLMTRLRLARKLYASIPFRKLRSLSRAIRRKSMRHPG